MKEGITHREYNIKSASYQDSTGKWIPQALISSGEKKPEEPLTWNKKFDSKAKADDFALQGAILYIDSKL